MTIPSRPAPAPPGSCGQSAAAGANASLEQLRQQLQQQHQQQQQLGGIQKSTIKLPPPPRGPMNNIINTQRNTSISHNNNNNNYDIFNGNNSSITRKFPQARYTPATNWDDTPFSSTINAPTQNGNFKKVPPPRPPPPKVPAVNGVRKTPARPQTSTSNTNILTSIFNRKKSTKALEASNNASRVYSVSSGNYGSTGTALTSRSSTSTTHHSTATTNGVSNAITDDWNACWNTTTTTTSYSAASYSSNQNSKQNAPTDGQLISFDSPPSSPTFTQKSNSDCLSVDSFSSDSNFSSPNNGSVSQPESGFEDDFSRSRPATTSPLDPWEAFNAFGNDSTATYNSTSAIGTAPVRNLSSINSRTTNDNPLCNGKSLLPPPPSLNMPTIIKPKISQKPKAPKPPLYLTKNTAATNGAAFSNDIVTTPTSPPMPQFAPPPPPAGVSLIDVISGKVDAIHLSSAAASYGAEETTQPYGISQYDFNGVEEDDLSFRENEKIYLLEKLNEEWYRGRTRAGCVGIFPANYIEIKVPLGNTTATSTSSSSSAYTSATTTPTGANSFTMESSTTYKSTTTTTTTTNNTTPRVRCLYNFPAEVEGDLALRENDVVTVLYRINEDWLYGEIAGRQGQFPANFLEYVPNNIPMP